MTSKRKKLLISILLSLLVILCGGALWSLFKWYRLPRTPKLFPSDKLMSAKGWKISQTRGGKKLYDASIESYSVGNAKLGPFAIGPLYVARLENVVIDFHSEGLLSEGGTGRHPSQWKTFGIDALSGPLADMRSHLLFRSKKVRILDINGVSLNLWEKEKRVFSIYSDHATFDRQTGDVVFTGHASLDAAENGNLISYRIRWVKKTSLFRIKDAFIMTQGNTKREGRELETDYQLRQIRYQINS